MYKENLNTKQNILFSVLNIFIIFTVHINIFFIWNSKMHFSATNKLCKFFKKNVGMSVCTLSPFINAMLGFKPSLSLNSKLSILSKLKSLDKYKITQNFQIFNWISIYPSFSCICPCLWCLRLMLMDDSYSFIFCCTLINGILVYLLY